MKSELFIKSSKIKVDSKEFKYFLAGFIEGEGSLNISIKKQKDCRFGFVIDPEFNLYQHSTGLPLLKSAQEMFRTGKIFKKSGSSDVYVYSIYNRKVIKEKVLVYFKKYVIPYSCKYSFIYTYEEILLDLEQKKHHTLEGFLKILENVYKINSLKGKDRKYNLEELRNIILRDYTPNK